MKSSLIDLLICIILCTTAAGLCGGCAPSANSSDVTAKETMTIPHYDEPVVLCGEAVVRYMNANASVPISEIVSKYSSKDILDRSVPISFWYRMHDESGDAAVVSAVLELADNESFSDAEKIEFPTGQTELSVSNCLPGQDYYYRITVTRENGSTETRQDKLTTASYPRIMTFENIRNVRDIGGWKTADGKIVSYGKLFRGPEIDAAVEPDYFATENDLAYLRDTLGVHFDCDLRDVKMDTEPGPLGPSVKRVGYGAWNYAKVFESVTTHDGYGRHSMYRVFHDLADPDNYPVYLHCTYGVDRTGTVCFLLESLLGVSLQDCVRDYELSALFHRSVDRDKLNGLIEAMSVYGSTNREQAEKYLLSVGITPKEIQTIREIFGVS